MTEPLKPCPYGCHREDIDHPAIQRGRVLDYSAICFECYARGPEAPSVAAATAAWNRRADDSHHVGEESDYTYNARKLAEAARKEPSE